MVLGVGLGMTGYSKIWPLFGAANQLLAALALLAVCCWLGNIGKNNKMFYIPMFFMLIVTLCSLFMTIKNKVGLIMAGSGDAAAYAQGILGAALFILCLLYTSVENALFDVFDDSDAYAVISMSEILDMMNSMIDVMITILTVIAAISLVVGGIGIMNIMLVSVTERTREIGIRKALEAKERSILGLFVTEAATTSALGGLLGIALGLSLIHI